MFTLSQQGSVTAGLLDQMNANFSELQSGVTGASGNGRTVYVNGSGGQSITNGEAWDTAYLTVQAACSAAQAGDVIEIAAGGYNEAVTLSVGGVTLRGNGGRGSVYLAPSASNAVALTVSGASDVTLINVGCEGDGTGGGLLVTGDVSRFRAYGCKCEGGAYGITIQGTASASPGDVRIVDCELCWTTTAMNIVVTGGGDPCTQVLVQGCLFHNYTADGIVNTTAHTADLWVIGNTFANQEDGTEPTQYLDIDVASTTGLVAGNVFATTVFASAKIGLASGVIFVNNQVQGENPGTAAYGTSGRPD